jgi:hypothetical protein
VYVELPEVGATVTKGETFGVVESVKVRAGGRNDGAPLSLFSPPTPGLAASRSHKNRLAPLSFPSTKTPPTNTGRLGRLLPHQRRGRRDQRRLGRRARQDQRRAARWRVDDQGQDVEQGRAGQPDEPRGLREAHSVRRERRRERRDARGGFPGRHRCRCSVFDCLEL